jgi:hypothetical protein
VSKIILRRKKEKQACKDKETNKTFSTKLKETDITSKFQVLVQLLKKSQVLLKLMILKLGKRRRKRLSIRLLKVIL